MESIVFEYYAWISSLSGLLTQNLGSLADSVNLPIFSTLIFGLIGAAAPCQLSSSTATLAYFSRQAGTPQKIMPMAIAYLLGKLTVYTLVGGMLVLLGLQIDQIKETAIPVVMISRKLMGPLLIIVGLLLTGLIKFNFTPGARLSAALQARLKNKTGLLPAYLMGVAFSLTFCPTLFWLFFGLTIPMALASPGGIFFPGVFALGTTLPILVLSALFGAQVIDLRQFLRRFRSPELWLQRISGLIFLLIGLQETILYWFI